MKNENKLSLGILELNTWKSNLTAEQLKNLDILNLKLQNIEPEIYNSLLSGTGKYGKAFLKDCLQNKIEWRGDNFESKSAIALLHQVFLELFSPIPQDSVDIIKNISISGAATQFDKITILLKFYFGLESKILLEKNFLTIASGLIELFGLTPDVIKSLKDAGIPEKLIEFDQLSIEDETLRSCSKSILALRLIESISDDMKKIFYLNDSKVDSIIANNMIQSLYKAVTTDCDLSQLGIDKIVVKKLCFVYAIKKFLQTEQIIKNAPKENITTEIDAMEKIVQIVNKIAPIIPEHLVFFDIMKIMDRSFDGMHTAANLLDAGIVFPAIYYIVKSNENFRIFHDIGLTDTMKPFNDLIFKKHAKELDVPIHSLYNECNQNPEDTKEQPNMVSILGIKPGILGLMSYMDSMIEFFDKRSNLIEIHVQQYFAEETARILKSNLNKQTLTQIKEKIIFHCKNLHIPQESILKVENFLPKTEHLLKNPKQYRVLLSELLEIFPNNGRIYKILGDVDLEHQQNKEALEYYNKVDVSSLKTTMDKFEFYKNKCLAKKKLGQDYTLEDFKLFLLCHSEMERQQITNTKDLSQIQNQIKIVYAAIQKNKEANQDYLDLLIKSFGSEDLLNFIKKQLENQGKKQDRAPEKQKQLPISEYNNQGPDEERKSQDNEPFTGQYKICDNHSNDSLKTQTQKHSDSSCKITIKTSAINMYKYTIDPKAINQAYRDEKHKKNNNKHEENHSHLNVKGTIYKIYDPNNDANKTSEELLNGPYPYIFPIKTQDQLICFAIDNQLVFSSPNQKLQFINAIKSEKFISSGSQKENGIMAIKNDNTITAYKVKINDGIRLVACEQITVDRGNIVIFNALLDHEKANALHQEKSPIKTLTKVYVRLLFAKDLDGLTSHNIPDYFDDEYNGFSQNYEPEKDQLLSKEEEPSKVTFASLQKLAGTQNQTIGDHYSASSCE